MIIEHGRPKMAIVDPNTLVVLGLKQILQNVMPIMTVETFATFEDFEAANSDIFFHFFVAQTVVLENLSFFSKNMHKTIVLTITKDPNSQLSGFHSLCLNAPEKDLIRAVLKNKILSNREIEVLSLIVQGMINKEIAEKLNISLTTVITHRKNIMDKLGMKSVSALTIYAVMHGYVDINNI